MNHRSETDAPDVAVARLQRLVERLASKPKFGHAIVGIERGDGTFRWRGASGTANADGAPMTPETPFFIASVTKLYIAALILQLHETGKVELSAPISTYLGSERIAGLHRIGPVDHTPQVTVFHLLSHTSGLGDYLEAKRDGGTSMYRQIAGGVDFSWGFDDVLAITRDQIRHHFPPQDPDAERRKGRYSDTGFQLLIAIIEEITGGSFADALDQRIIKPLDLRQTWLPGNSQPLDPAPPATDLWSDGRPLEIPQAMASLNDLYSTADDTLTFLAALRGSELFADPSTYPLMEKRRNRVIWPLIHYGLGTMHFKIGRLNAPGRRPLNLIGHSGATGSWLFYCPELDLLTTGTVDEVNARAFPFRFIPKLLRAVAR
ncbi:MAG: serine hydrolase domain-containing protein [Acidimicrobiales bacterium]